MTQHDPDGDIEGDALSAEPWRERFSEAFGDSLDLYTELFALSPAPVMVDDWSQLRPFVLSLQKDTSRTIEEQIRDDPELGRLIWSKIRHIAANPAMLEITRIPGADLFDDFMDIYEPSIAPSIGHVLGRFSEGIFDVQWPEMTVAAADGEPLTVRGRILVPPAYRDTWRIVLSSFKDVTRERERERELLEAKQAAELAARAKSEFLATMSHEFRTPLNAVMGFAQVLQAETFGPLGDSRYVRYAEDIIASGDHLLGLVEDILDLAQAQDGKMVLKLEAAALIEITEQALRLVRDRATRSGIALKVDVSGDLPLVRADSRRMRQLLLNLLTNAIKFTPPGGTITITGARAPGQGLVLSVADTGQGMDSAEAALAMEPFTQVRRSHRQQADGWGLGLPIARHIAELHGGRLELQSTPGKGTKVSIHLPLNG